VPKRRLGEHPIEVTLRRTIDALLHTTDTSVPEFARALGLTPLKVYRRQRGMVAWATSEVGHAADYWWLAECTMLAGPDEAVAQLPPDWERPEEFVPQDPHPVETQLRGAVATVSNLAGENLTDIARSIDLTPPLVSRRQRGEVSWTICEVGYLADHWRIDECSLISGPSTALAALDPEYVTALRAARGLPPIPLPLMGAAA
jgi:hypothetical protein